MKILNKKLTILTNFVIGLLIILVSIISFTPQSIVPIYGGERVQAIYNGNKQKNDVALMINVYENADVVCQMIDVLTKYNAKATFFVGGCWADDNKDTLVKIVQSGNEIANHGYFHLDHKNISYDKNYQEINLTGIIVESLSGVKPTLFAPPSGSFSDHTLESAFELGYKVIMWTKDTIDWRDSDVDLIVNRATKNPENGDFILMHPKSHTLKALPKIIEFYQKSGYNLTTVSDCLL